MSAPAIKSRPNGANSNLCEQCGTKPKYHDGTRLHKYCGKTCAGRSRSGSSSQTTSQQPGGTCAIGGCQKAVFVDPNSGPSKYCSIKHKKIAEEVCLWCKNEPKQHYSHYCSRTCMKNATSTAPSILEVPIGHVTFKSIAEQFKSSWKHSNKPCPNVRRVYKILGTGASVSLYNKYRDAVEARGQFVSRGRSPGNENRRWHGTRRECSLGDPGHTQICGSTTCSLCNIVKTTFDLSFVKKSTGWGRFGAGIYTSSTSSKSDDYSNNGNVQSNLKAILLNKVVVGKGFKLFNDRPTLTGPPPGYDSVLAEVGGSLNYDELVVYTDDAVRPSYLVMYDA